MTKTEHLLFILSEECAEVAQRCSKAARFTLEERQSHNNIATELTSESDYSNGQRIALELTQLIAVAEMLNEIDAFPDGYGHQHLIDSKKYKVEKFLEYSKKVGTLDD